MSSESERKLSLEELKQLNRPKTMPPQPAPMPPAHPPQWEQAELLVGTSIIPRPSPKVFEALM